MPVFSFADASEIIRNAAKLPPCRPGERLLAGRPYVYNQDLLNAYEADLAIKNMGEDVGAMSDSELDGLFYQWLNRYARLPLDRLTIRAGTRICGERARRAAGVSA